MSMTLPTDSNERKEIPLFSGVLAYAPAALAGMARISKQGNDKHNPGQPLHHARGKSADHADCIVRHLVDVADIKAGIDRCDAGEDWADNYKLRDAQITDLLSEVSQLVWRSVLLSQELHEKYGGAPLAPGARLPEIPPVPGCHIEDVKKPLKPGMRVRYKDESGTACTGKLLTLYYDETKWVATREDGKGWRDSSFGDSCWVIEPKDIEVLL